MAYAGVYLQREEEWIIILCPRFAGPQGKERWFQYLDGIFGRYTEICIGLYGDIFVHKQGFVGRHIIAGIRGDPEPVYIYMNFKYHTKTRMKPALGQ